VFIVGDFSYVFADFDFSGCILFVQVDLSQYDFIVFSWF